MKIFDAYRAKLAEFKPKDKAVRMYVCGPTVYDLGHLGHGRSMVVFDMMRRYLKFKDYKVHFVTNYTDVDDKIIKRANEGGFSGENKEQQLVEKIIPEYEKDFEALGIPQHDENEIQHVRATQTITEMIDLIKVLEEKGFTYAISDGVYYDVTKFENYGKLSKQKMSELDAGARVAVKEEKKDPRDFVLWKFSKPGEPKWPSPWGDGRPGWHIECSAMIHKRLGNSIDIHGGGIDLIFPHHECEIAQSEAAYGEPFVKNWVYNGFVQIDKEKMSKSLGNFFTLRDIFKKYKSPQALRLWFLQTHYRSPIDFSEEVIMQAKNSLDRLHDFWRRLQNYKTGEFKGTDKKLFTNALKDFEQAMDSDFDTAGGLAVLFNLVRQVNALMDDKSQQFNEDFKNRLIEVFQKIDSVLGVLIPSRNDFQTMNISDEEVEELIKKRDEARKSKNWAESDSIRKDLLEKGVQVEDSAGGSIWKRL